MSWFKKREKKECENKFQLDLVDGEFEVLNLNTVDENPQIFNLQVCSYISRFCLKKLKNWFVILFLMIYYLRIIINLG